ncbi:rano class II histocompatibility antigen, A beta chain [Megalops cyprinoides]|uniref:rano class II histocompatibility antigen, A beta chain n=1 Tax=Megalops cyprinoides TaxID=118141 RepID=UPI001864998B|nr:rano class II histocompatibility antigen, A beta chain [Megalops cyprinoides]
MILLYLFSIGFMALIAGEDEHAYQQHIGCAFNSFGQVGHFWRYGFNHKEIMHVDLAKEAVVATSLAGNFLADERNNRNTYFRSKEKRLRKVCSAVQTVFSLSNSTLSRAAKPTVEVALGGEEGQEYLLCSVHGFYPNVIRVRWVHNGKQLSLGTTTSGILPHRDGTFQMTIYLSLSNRSASGIACEVEHISIDGKERKTLEEPFHYGLLMAIAASVVGLLLPVCLTAWKVWTRIKDSRASVSDSTSSSRGEPETPPSMSLMQIEEEEITQ